MLNLIALGSEFLKNDFCFGWTLCFFYYGFRWISLLLAFFFHSCFLSRNVQKIFRFSFFIPCLEKKVCIVLFFFSGSRVQAEGSWWMCWSSPRSSWLSGIKYLYLHDWFDKHLQKYLQKYLFKYFVISKVILTFKICSIIIENSFPARNVSRDIPAPKIPIDFLGARYNEGVQVEVNRRELMKI